MSSKLTRTLSLALVAGLGIPLSACGAEGSYPGEPSATVYTAYQPPAKTAVILPTRCVDWARYLDEMTSLDKMDDAASEILAAADDLGIAAQVGRLNADIEAIRKQKDLLSTQANAFAEANELAQLAKKDCIKAINASK